MMETSWNLNYLITLRMRLSMDCCDMDILRITSTTPMQAVEAEVKVMHLDVPSCVSTRLNIRSDSIGGTLPLQHAHRWNLARGH